MSKDFNILLQNFDYQLKILFIYIKCLICVLNLNFKFYNDHHIGRVDRYKVRFRKYIESDLTFLEIKHKIKGRTKKSRIIVDEIPNELTNEKHISFLKKNISETIDLKPKLWNSFHRITLVNNELKERLTFDFQLTFKWETEEINFNNLIIAELKQEIVYRNSPFYNLMKSNQIRPYRLSKYCIGAIELYAKDKIKYNRFKEKLLKLNPTMYTEKSINQSKSGKICSIVGLSLVGVIILIAALSTL
jgi:hypothetical protein